jgi:hypothetical protein
LEDKIGKLFGNVPKLVNCTQDPGSSVLCAHLSSSTGCSAGGKLSSHALAAAISSLLNVDSLVQPSAACQNTGTQISLWSLNRKGAWRTMMMSSAYFESICPCDTERKTRQSARTDRAATRLCCTTAYSAGNRRGQAGWGEAPGGQERVTARAERHGGPQGM